MPDASRARHDRHRWLVPAALALAVVAGAIAVPRLVQVTSATWVTLQTAEADVSAVVPVTPTSFACVDSSGILSSGIAFTWTAADPAPDHYLLTLARSSGTVVDSVETTSTTGSLGSSVTTTGRHLASVTAVYGPSGSEWVSGASGEVAVRIAAGGLTYTCG